MTRCNSIPRDDNVQVNKRRGAQRACLPSDGLVRNFRDANFSRMIRDYHSKPGGGETLIEARFEFGPLITLSNEFQHRRGSLYSRWPRLRKSTGI